MTTQSIRDAYSGHIAAGRGSLHHHGEVGHQWPGVRLALDMGRTRLNQEPDSLASWELTRKPSVDLTELGDAVCQLSYPLKYTSLRVTENSTNRALLTWQEDM